MGTKPRRVGGPRRFMRRLVRRPAAMAGGLVLLFVIVVAVLAPVLAPYDPNETSPDLRHLSLSHPFGTDELGRDVLSQTYGERVYTRQLISIGIALIGGTFIGIVSGYWGGWLDSLIMRLMDVMLAFPGFSWQSPSSQILGPSLFNVMIAVGIESIPVYARHLSRIGTRYERGRVHDRRPCLSGQACYTCIWDEYALAKHPLPL